MNNEVMRSPHRQGGADAGLAATRRDSFAHELEHAVAETSMVQRQWSSMLEHSAKSEATSNLGEYCFIMGSTMNERC